MVKIIKRQKAKEKKQKRQKEKKIKKENIRNAIIELYVYRYYINTRRL